MGNKKQRPAALAGEILYPVLLYYVLTLVIMYAARSIFGADKAHYMLCQLTVGIFLLPLMYLGFYRPDTAVWGRKYAMEDRSGKRLLLLLTAVLLLGSGLNNVLVMSPLAALSSGYQEANDNFYGSTLVIELLASGILTPVLEEVTFRGIVYGRARRTFGVLGGILLQALIFAILHFNPVQFLYAFLMGILFGLLLERTGSLKTVIAAHMLINTLAICRTEFGWLSTTTNGSLPAWAVSLAFLLAGGLLLGDDLRHNFHTIFGKP